jgi:hypothetical protein
MGKTGRVNASELPMMPRDPRPSPMEGSSGVQGWPLRSGRRWPVEVSPVRWTPPPRGKGSTHPGRISFVWNVETPLGSGACAWSADREEGSTPQREQDGPRS